MIVMLCPQSMSVERFFDRDDEEKQFILQQINLAANPEDAMKNYKNCLAKVNSIEHYENLVNSGFFTCVRDENRTIEEALEQLECHFGLIKSEESLGCLAWNQSILDIR